MPIKKTFKAVSLSLSFVFSLLAFGCNQNRYQPAEWQQRDSELSRRSELTEDTLSDEEIERRFGTLTPWLDPDARLQAGGDRIRPGDRATLPRSSNGVNRSTLPLRGSTLPLRGSTLPQRSERMSPLRGSTLPLRNAQPLRQSVSSTLPLRSGNQRSGNQSSTGRSDQTLPLRSNRN